MNISSTKGHGRCPVLKFCTWAIFDVCLHTFPIFILKFVLHEKCSFACLFSCAKILEIFIEYLWKYALKSRHRSISKVTSFLEFYPPCWDGLSLCVFVSFKIVQFIFLLQTKFLSLKVLLYACTCMGRARFRGKIYCAICLVGLSLFS